VGSLVITSAYSKKRSRIDKILHDASCATSHGSQLVAHPLAKDLGLSEKIRKTRCLDPREDKSRELSYEHIAIGCFCAEVKIFSGRAKPFSGKLAEDWRWPVG
jgi:hypothetical protein